MDKKILLVEDDQFLRELYLSLLKNANYAVEVAVDGESAHAKIREGGWDLILLDVMLPKLTGFEVMKKIKQEPQPIQNKKIIFMTNLDDSEQLKQVSELGDGCLIKSDLTPDVFLEKVKGYLSYLQK